MTSLNFIILYIIYIYTYIFIYHTSSVLAQKASNPVVVI